MAASKNPHLRLLHIQRETTWMLDVFASASEETFVADVVSIRSAERGLLIISEAAKSLPDDLIATYPDVEWHAIRAIGNVLRHDYERIEPHRLWVIITRDLPKLHRLVGEMIAKHKPGG
jgi:uncharacterized protein with HEPN domain